MERLSKLFSLLLLFLGSITCILWVQIDTFFDVLEKGLNDSKVIILYTEHDVTPESIKLVEGIIAKRTDLEILSYNDSDKILASMKAEPLISDYIELVGEDFMFPANFEVIVKNVDIDKLKELKVELEKLPAIKYIDVNYEFLQKASDFEKLVKNFSYIIRILLPLIALVLFYVSGFYTVLQNRESINLGFEALADIKTVLFPILKHQFLLGSLTGLLGLAVYYLIIILLSATFFIGFSKIIMIIVICGTMSAAGLLANSYSR